MTKYEIVRLIYDPAGTIEVWTGSTSFPSEDLGLVEDLIDLVFPPRKHRNGAVGKNTRLKNHFYHGEAITISRLTSSPDSTSTSSGRMGSSRIGNI